jgi:hypothetical protein
MKILRVSGLHVGMFTRCPKCEVGMTTTLPRDSELLYGTGYSRLATKQKHEKYS